MSINNITVGELLIFMSGEFYSCKIAPPFPPKICTCKAPQHLNAFGARQFKPLSYEIISNMEIIKEIIEEKLDVPLTTLV